MHVKPFNQHKTGQLKNNNHQHCSPSWSCTAFCKGDPSLLEISLAFAREYTPIGILRAPLALFRAYVLPRTMRTMPSMNGNWPQRTWSGLPRDQFLDPIAWIPHTSPHNSCDCPCEICTILGGYYCTSCPAVKWLQLSTTYKQDQGRGRSRPNHDSLPMKTSISLLARSHLDDASKMKGKSRHVSILWDSKMGAKVKKKSDR